MATLKEIIPSVYIVRPLGNLLCLTFEQETWTNWQMFGSGSSQVDEKQSLTFLIFCF